MADIKAELIDHMGSDLTVINAAKVSFHKEAKTYSTSDERLIRYLAVHNHWTPFAHPQITIRESVPMFVARQRFKHMVGFTYNEVSRRYVSTPPEYYVPPVWHEKPEGSIKQGAGGAHKDQKTLKLAYETAVAMCDDIYHTMLNKGVAPEQARMVLPMSMMTEYYVTGSLAAFARAYAQRIDSHAQFEIQKLAVKWNEIIQPLFPVSWKHLTEGASAHE